MAEVRRRTLGDGLGLGVAGISVGVGQGAGQAVEAARRAAGERGGPGFFRGLQESDLVASDTDDLYFEVELDLPIEARWLLFAQATVRPPTGTPGSADGAQVTIGIQGDSGSATEGGLSNGGAGLPRLVIPYGPADFVSATSMELSVSGFWHGGGTLSVGLGKNGGTGTWNGDLSLTAFYNGPA